MHRPRPTPPLRTSTYILAGISVVNILHALSLQKKKKTTTTNVQKITNMLFCFVVVFVFRHESNVLDRKSILEFISEFKSSILVIFVYMTEMVKILHLWKKKTKYNAV